MKQSHVISSSLGSQYKILFTFWENSKPKIVYTENIALHCINRIGIQY